MSPVSGGPGEEPAAGAFRRVVGFILEFDLVSLHATNYQLIALRGTLTLKKNTGLPIASAY